MGNTDTACRGENHHLYKHGGSRTPTYVCWLGMHQRCTDENVESYPRYGGRGIAVDPRWDDYANFLADMGEVPTGMSIDRKDNNGPYSPANCRWATRSEQARNRNCQKRYTCDGKSLLLIEWHELTGIPFGALVARVVKLNWSIERALKTPLLANKKREVAAIPYGTTATDDVPVPMTEWARRHGIGTTHAHRLFKRGKLPVKVVSTDRYNWVVTDPEKFATWTPPRKYQKKGL